MVSAWATENNLVLAQVKVDENSNEITAIPKLLAVLDLKGCIITIDAMGTQKKIAETIIAKEADYILSLKGNQGNICEDVQQLFDWALKNNFENIDHQSWKTIEKGHGRIEIRRYWLMSEVKYLMDSEKWRGLKSIGVVESERRIKGKETTIERRYYLTSLEQGVKQFAQGIRSHWGIENQLHWCLDVAFKEDDSRMRQGHSAENMALIRHLVLNLLNKETEYERGKKAQRLKAAWDDEYLLKILSS